MVDTMLSLGRSIPPRDTRKRSSPMAKSSKVLLSLSPVTFRYKKELDPKAIPQFGLVAEDVAKVNPDLVARDKEGMPWYSRQTAQRVGEVARIHGASPWQRHR